MSVLTVCKNVIMSNNKKGWINPEPAIRISNTKSGKVSGRGHFVNILDENHQVVATIETT